MPGGYVYKDNGITYLCSNDPISIHRNGNHMIGDHYLSAIAINGEELEDGETFGPYDLIVDWDEEVGAIEIAHGNLPKVTAKRVKKE